MIIKPKEILRILFAYMLLIFPFVYGQNPVTRIFSDHANFTSSSTSNPQSLVVTTQNLLAFQTGNMIWSTGVDNAKLAANNINAVPLNFNAMPATVASSNTNAFIGIGKNYGGFNVGSNGCDPNVPLPYGTNLSAYLTDGLHGLDISTGVFNIGGIVVYTVANIDPTAIGDGVPDILITQVGELSANVWDKFRFLDMSNNLIGNVVDVNFSQVLTVSRPHWKFYSLSGACGAISAGPRDMRLLAFDFSALGITTSNYGQIKKFEHKMTPNTDVAFVAYNTISATILPITLAHFDAVLKDDEVEISWTTAAEINSDFFTVERSLNGTDWESIAEVAGVGDSQVEHVYQTVDSRPVLGMSYYRLVQTDFDGTRSYSPVKAIQNDKKGARVFPNPVEDILTIIDESIGDISLVSLSGKSVLHPDMIVNKGKNVIQLNVQNLESGFYLLSCGTETHSVVVK